MKMQYMLDTNICIYIAKNKPLSVLQQFKKLEVGQVSMSTITYGELLFGIEKSKLKKETLKYLQDLTHLIPPLPLPTDAGEYYGSVRASLEKKGTIIGNNDLWIAAHALSLDITLITNNGKEFKRIENLKVENWL